MMKASAATTNSYLKRKQVQNDDYSGEGGGGGLKLHYITPRSAAASYIIPNHNALHYIKLLQIKLNCIEFINFTLKYVPLNWITSRFPALSPLIFVLKLSRVIDI